MPSVINCPSAKLFYVLRVFNGNECVNVRIRFLKTPIFSVTKNFRPSLMPVRIMSCLQTTTETAKEIASYYIVIKAYN